MNVRNQIVREKDGQVGDVFQPLADMVRAGGYYGLGSAIQQKIHDGNVMRRQIPNDVDIVLKQTEVDAYGIEIIDVADIAVIQILFDQPHGAGVNKGVIQHQHQLFLIRQFHQFFGLRRGGGHGFFEHHVFAGQQRRLGYLIMGEYRRADRHRIDVRRLDDLLIIRCRQNGRVFLFDERQPLAAQV